MKCQKCGKEVALPFRCPYCGGYFCAEHRLPENHDCPGLALARAPKKEQTVSVQKQKPYEYTISYTPFERKKVTFSSKEIKHLTIGALLIAAIGFSPKIWYPNLNFYSLTILTVILLFSFFTHELAHKIVAEKKGFWAEFRIILTGAILTLISIFPLWFKIISPGAVMVAGAVDRKSSGEISVAGPLTNILFSTIFFYIGSLPGFAYASIFMLGSAFNAWIALFNLIPFGIFDGFKVFLWDKKIWALTFAASLILTILTYRTVI